MNSLLIVAATLSVAFTQAFHEGYLIDVKSLNSQGSLYLRNPETYTVKQALVAARQGVPFTLLKSETSEQFSPDAGADQFGWRDGMNPIQLRSTQNVTTPIPTYRRKFEVSNTEQRHGEIQPSSVLHFLKDRPAVHHNHGHLRVKIAGTLSVSRKMDTMNNPTVLKTFDSSVLLQSSSVTIEGYIADILCVNRVTALDGPNMITNPQGHSKHCAVYPPCIPDGYTILTPPTSATQTSYGPMYNFSTSGNSVALAWLRTLSEWTRNLYVKVEVQQGSDGSVTPTDPSTPSPTTTVVSTTTTTTQAPTTTPAPTTASPPITTKPAPTTVAPITTAHITAPMTSASTSLPSTNPQTALDTAAILTSQPPTTTGELVVVPSSSTPTETFAPSISPPADTLTWNSVPQLWTGVFEGKWRRIAAVTDAPNVQRRSQHIQSADDGKGDLIEIQLICTGDRYCAWGFTPAASVGMAGKIVTCYASTTTTTCSFYNSETWGIGSIASPAFGEHVSTVRSEDKATVTVHLNASMIGAANTSTQLRSIFASGSWSPTQNAPLKHSFNDRKVTDIAYKISTTMAPLNTESTLTPPATSSSTVSAPISSTTAIQVVSSPSTASTLAASTAATSSTSTVSTVDTTTSQTPATTSRPTTTFVTTVSSPLPTAQNGNAVNDQQQAADDEANLSAGTVVLIVVGSLIVVAAIAVLVAVKMKKGVKSTRSQEEREDAGAKKNDSYYQPPEIQPQTHSTVLRSLGGRRDNDFSEL